MIFRLLPLLVLLATAPAAAQSVADYYHAAAQSYIGGQHSQAEAAAEAGLALDPTDAKLRALLAKIRERNPQDGGGEQDQDADAQEQGEQQENAEGGEQQESESEGEPQDGQDRQQEGRQQPEDPSQQRQDEGDAGAEGEQDPSSPQGGGSTAAPFDVKPGEMSRAEAERILRALEADEIELLRDVQRRRVRPRYVEKDW